ncbi:adenine nucleotide alpha hydrolases-like protein [Gonapodya prolifera JEL478]|uniref:Adenine nucleotide alpha hydrolases-like protein n=1 Tax=Gonapodya prolifera (strain JEL478) TaxID=1344416 RepID=A0A139AXH9_GONPJ|nr:adenine nucleotide alpha hydrolases-like protein [Gonapodya prolifera JEL478]|eukprot:KXS21417.1 adenine nucleotide alpha hydrolases-like protein [Gonapodya prolifera JEL478]
MSIESDKPIPEFFVELLHTGEVGARYNNLEEAIQTTATRRHLVACDFSRESLFAIEFAIARVVSDGDALILVNVVPDAAVLDTFCEDDQTMGTTNTEDLLRDVVRRLATVHKSASKPLHLPKHSTFAGAFVGLSGAVLCNVCLRLNVDTIVLGTHARSPIGKVLFGSVGDYCLHHAPTSVVVVRPKHPQM